MIEIARKIIAGILMVSTLLMFTGCAPVTITVTITIGTSTGSKTPVPTKPLLDPPGSDLATFDTTQAILTYTLANGKIDSTSGPAVLSVIDHSNGQTVGQQTFGYVVVGNSLYAQDPTAVHNWLMQFTGYADVDLLVDVTPIIAALGEGDVSATASVVYQGTTYSSATVSWRYEATSPGGGCHTRICPNQ